MALRAGAAHRRPRLRRAPPSLLARGLALLTARGSGAAVALALIAAVGCYGVTLDGRYAAFVASQGTIPDFLARTAGFGIKGIAISGLHELSNREILAAADIGHTDSLPFLDVTKLRARLVALPLVKDASVSKLYPNRVMIEIAERQPFALWQKDGAVKIIAADGTPITVPDAAHFTDLPLVVGDGANARIGEYLALLKAAGSLRPRIRAGMLIAERRWTLKMTNGVEVALPELGAPAAVAELVKLQQRHGVLDKDIVSLDLRFPGRLIARLPDATRARLDAEASTAKGSQT